MLLVLQLELCRPNQDAEGGTGIKIAEPQIIRKDDMLHILWHQQRCCALQQLAAAGINI